MALWIHNRNPHIKAMPLTITFRAFHRGKTLAQALSERGLGLSERMLGLSYKTVSFSDIHGSHKTNFFRKKAITFSLLDTLIIKSVQITFQIGQSKVQVLTFSRNNIDEITELFQQ